LHDLLGSFGRYRSCCPFTATGPANGDIDEIDVERADWGVCFRIIVWRDALDFLKRLNNGTVRQRITEANNAIFVANLIIFEGKIRGVVDASII